MDTQLKTNLITHSGIKMIFKDDNWEIINLVHKTSFRANYLTCIVLIIFMDIKNIEEGYREIQKYIKINKKDFQKIVSSLNKREAIVEENNESHMWSLDILKKWSKYGWRKSADYHLLTYNYPFLDYRGKGRATDFDLMDIYGEEEPDTYRGKKYPLEIIQEEIPVKSPIKLLKKLNMSYSSGYHERQLINVNKEVATELMSLLFGILRKRRVPTKGAEDLVRKINPSGGSRHPSEGYLFNISIESFKKGIYHFSSITSTLDLVGELPKEEIINEYFDGPYRADFEPEAFIIVTSEFERNMYRYREPRTFRTVFMDVGHIVENVNIICRHIGLNSYQHHGVNNQGIEELLGLNYLREGVIMAVAIGGNKNDK